MPKLTSADVLRLVEVEIAGERERTTSHCLDLSRSILRPPREEAVWFGAPETQQKHLLWLVLVEDPTDESGYWIFYDPDDRRFGLALKDDSGAFHHVGTYGSLWDTLEGM